MDILNHKQNACISLGHVKWWTFHFDPPQLKTTFSTDSRVQNMFDILLDDEMEKDKREKVGI